MKKGNWSEFCNYRPVVIICNFAKCFEMLLFNDASSHCKHLITEAQHDFVKSRSTTANLFCMTEFLTDTIDEVFQADVIYTDFSKPFDRTDHGRLLNANYLSFLSKLFEILKVLLLK